MLGFSGILYFKILIMEVTKAQVEELQGYFSPYWYLDLKTAIEHGQEVGLFPSDIYDLINDARECMGFKQFEAFDEMDPVYYVLDHILQMARNEIDNVLGYDFINDLITDNCQI